MMFPQVSSEFERMCACGRSVCTTTLGLRGSETSTAVKFFGALSCASQMMRRPSGAICTDMPSPMPPKPPSSCWASSLKFQHTGSYFAASGLFSITDMSCSLGFFRAQVLARSRSDEKAAARYTNDIVPAKACTHLVGGLTQTALGDSRRVVSCDSVHDTSLWRVGWNLEHVCIP